LVSASSLKRVFRIDPRHELLLSFEVGEPVDETQPVADYRFASVPPGVVDESFQLDVGEGR
jgi:hypothetical protein